MPRICVFDVNETLLDLAVLDAPFESAFGRPGVRREWFSQLLQSAFLATVTDAYVDFGTIGRAALEMVAERRGVRLSSPDREAAGLRLAALTNSTDAVARIQLHFSGLDPYFERILSADTVRRLKPAREPYELAAREFGVEIAAIRLIAAHSWDIAGAKRAGAAAAFVARPGMVLDPLGPRPDVIGSDLDEVADRILAIEIVG